MMGVALPVLLVLMCLCPPFSCQEFEVQMWLTVGCGCSYSVQEGKSLEVCVGITFINGTLTTTSDYDVNLTTESGSAIGDADYTSLSPWTLTFPMGSKKNDVQCAVINIIDDDAVECQESFIVYIESNDPRVDFSSLCQSARVYISDSDVITVGVVNPAVVHLESPARSGMICLNITRGRLECSAYVYYSTQTGTAADSYSTYRDYYRRTNKKRYFDSGSGVGDTECVYVSIYDDTWVENDEYFTVNFRSGYRTVVDTTAASARITIADDDVAVIDVESWSTSISVTENTTYIYVCVQLLQTERIEVGLSAFISTMDETATGGRDYDIITNQTISFPYGSRSGDRNYISIRILEDTILENSETFQVFLTQVSPQLLIGSSATALVTIYEDADYVSVGFHSLEFTSTEGNGTTADVCVQIFTGALERSVSVYLTTDADTATAPSDYIHVESQEIVFNSGQSSNLWSTSCISLDIVNDSVLEDQERFLVALTSLLPVVLLSPGQDEAAVVIDEDQNDGVVIGFPIGEMFVATEGSDASASVCLEILQGELEREVTVFATTSNGTAKAFNDYSPLVSAEVTLTSGLVASDRQCILIPILDDNNVFEDAVETFSVHINAQDPAVSIVSDRNSTTVTINEDTLDGVTVGLQRTTYFTDETAGFLTVCAQMFNYGSLERNVSLTLVSRNSTAIAPGDYIDFTTTIVFTDGQATGALACADLQVVDDNVVEEDEESLFLSLSADEPLVTTTTVVLATVIIRENDNDVAGSINLTSANFDAFEPDGGVNVCVSIAATALERDITVHLSSQDNTATHGADYTSFQLQQITFSSGARFGEEKCHFTEVADDDILEASEFFTVTLSSFEPAFLAGDQTQATVTINPDPADFVELSFQRMAYTGTEQSTLRDETICVEIVNGTIERDVVVYVTSTNGTAESGIDYTGPSPSVLTFGSGLAAGHHLCTKVSVLDDTIIEYEETFNISLSVAPADVNVVIFNGGDIATFSIIQDPNDRAFVRLLDTTLSELEGKNISICTELSNISGEVRRPLSLTVEFSSASAEDGVDFAVTGPTTEVVFPPNSNSGIVQCVAVELLTDRLLEAPETFVAHLNTNDPALEVDFNAGLAIITVLDVPDPNAVGVSFILIHYDITENDIKGLVEVCVEIVVGTVVVEDSVQVETISGTATADRDFISTSQFLTFYPQETVGTKRCLNITILDDSIVEGDVMFYVILSFTGFIQAVGNTTVNITIHEDSDYIEVQLAVPNVVTSEGGGKSEGGTDGIDPGIIGSGSGSNCSRAATSAVQACIELASGSLQRNVSLNAKTVSSTRSTATVNEDYCEVDTNLTFTSGQNASGDNLQCLYIPILDDTILECNETFDLLITPTMEDADIVNITSQLLTITIEEDTTDYVEVCLLPVNFTVVSENQMFSVCAQLTHGTVGCDASVDLDIQSDTAVEGVDFTSPDPSALIFTPGQTVGYVQCARITIIDDLLPQPERNFSIALKNGTTIEDNGGSSGTGRVRISDILSSVTVEIGTDMADGLSHFMYEVREGPLLGPFATVSVCATIEVGTASRSISVNLTTPVIGPNVIATPIVDFIPISEKLTFSEGQSEGDSVCTEITIISDSLVENQETFEVILLPDPDDIFAAFIQPGKDRGTVTISDGEENNSVEVQPAVHNISITEGEGGGGDGIIGSGDGTSCSHAASSAVQACVELVSGNLQRNVSVNVRTVSSASSTATVNEDYCEVDTNLTFTSGQNTSGDNLQCLYIPILDDTILECNETFDLLITPTMEDAEIVTVTGPLLTITIIEDAADYLEVRLLPVNSPALSENQMFSVCAQLTYGTVGCDTSVDLDIKSDSTFDCAEGADIISPDQSALMFTPGQTVGDIQCARITIVDDLLPQPDRNLTISLGSSSIDGSGRTGRVRIDDVLPPVTVEIRADMADVIRVNLSKLVYEAAEGASAEATVCVVIEQGTVRCNTTVQLVTTSSSGSTATPVLDYVPFAKFLEFTVGQTVGDSVCTALAIVEDRLNEDTETFEVILYPAPDNSFKVIIPSEEDRAVVSISDGEAYNVVEVSPVSSVITVTEGNVATFCLAVSLGSLQKEIQVNVKSIAGVSSTATANEDYSAFVRSITLTSNEPVCSNITIINDDIVEKCEAFYIGFEVDATASRIAAIPRDVDKVVVVIVDDPADGVKIGFNSSEVTITEGNMTIVLCVEITSGILEKDITIFMETVSPSDLPGYAQPGQDYLEIKEHKLVFGQDITAVCTPIDIVDDDVLESTETFTVLLVAAIQDRVGVDFSTQRATVQILEDTMDEIVVGLSSNVFRVSKESGSALVCVELFEGRLQREVSVLLEASDYFGKDYYSISKELYFNSGEPPGTLSCVNITVVDDNAVNEREDFMVTISQLSPGVAFRPSASMATIELTDTKVYVSEAEDGNTEWIVIATPSAAVVLVFAIAIVLLVLFCCLCLKTRKKRKEHEYHEGFPMHDKLSSQN